MAVTVQKFNNFSLIAPDYEALLRMPDNPGKRAVTPVITRTPTSYPRIPRFNRMEREIVLTVRILASDFETKTDTLLREFRPGILGALEVDFSGTTRVLDLFIVTVVPYSGAHNRLVVTAIAPTGPFRSLTTNTTTQTITSSGSSWAITNAGNSDEDGAVIRVTPNASKPGSSGWQHRFEVVVGNRSEQPLSNYSIDIGGSTGFAHNSEVTAGRSLASGNDVRVFIDGIEENRFPGEDTTASTGNDFNNTSDATSLWVTDTFQPKREAKLLNAITSVSPATGGVLEVEAGGTSGWPETGAMCFTATAEVIEYTGIRKETPSQTEAFTGITRGARNTVASASSAGDSGFRVEKRVQILTGYTNAGIPSAPTSKKPMFDLTSATLSNTRHEWASFVDVDNPGRPMQWRRLLRPLDDQSPYIATTNNELKFIAAPEGGSSSAPNFNTWRHNFPAPLKTAGFSSPTTATVTRTAAGTSVVAPAPTGFTAGNVFFAQATSNIGGSNWNTPAGWTDVGVETGGQQAYYRVAQGGDTNWTFTIGTGSADLKVAIVELAGLDSTDPIIDSGALLVSDATPDRDAMQVLNSPSINPDTEGPAVLFLTTAFVGGGVTITATGTPHWGDDMTTAWNDGGDDPSIFGGFVAWDRIDQAEPQEVTFSGTGAGSSYWSVFVLRLAPVVEGTRVLDDTMALQWFLEDTDGHESLRLQEVGPAVSGTFGVAASPVNKMSRVDVYGRSALAYESPVARNAESQLNLQIAPTTTDAQQFTVIGDGSILQWQLKGTGANAATFGCDLWSDNGSDAPSASLVTADHPSSTKAAEIKWYTFTPTIPHRVSTGTLLWLLPHGSTSLVAHLNAGEYSGGVSTETDVFNFRVKSLDLTPDSQTRPAAGERAEISALTAHLDTDLAPFVDVRGREDVYVFNQAILENTTTGQTATIDAVVAVTDVLEINVANRTVTNTTTGENLISQIEFSDAANWFTIEPGTNNFRLTESGLVSVSVDVDHFDRWE